MGAVIERPVVTVPCCASLCCAVPRCAVPCCAVPCRAVLCRAEPSRAVPCCAVLCRPVTVTVTVPCRAVPCRTVPCRAVPCRAGCRLLYSFICWVYGVRAMVSAIDSGALPQEGVGGGGALCCQPCTYRHRMGGVIVCFASVFVRCRCCVVVAMFTPLHTVW